ncbi:MAG: tetratricopeptide repeat protein [Candidatus Hodarchaeales archaeon]|jgi:tetratricopeptide (TPR) repeat protein
MKPADPFVEKMESLYDEEKFSEMLSICKTAIEQPGNKKMAQLYYCIALFNLNKHAEAAENGIKFVTLLNAADYRLKSRYYRLIGFSFLELKQIDEALSWFDQSLKVSQLNEDYKSMASSLFALGNLLEETGDLKGAFGNYEKAWELQQKKELSSNPDNDYQLIILLQALARINLKFNQSETKKEAKRYLELALKIARDCQLEFSRYLIEKHNLKQIVSDQLASLE